MGGGHLWKIEHEAAGWGGEEHSAGRTRPRKGSGRQECEAQRLPWLEAGWPTASPSRKQDLGAAPPCSQGKGAEMIWAWRCWLLFLLPAVSSHPVFLPSGPPVSPLPLHLLSVHHLWGLLPGRPGGLGHWSSLSLVTISLWLVSNDSNSTSSSLSGVYSFSG